MSIDLIANFVPLAIAALVFGGLALIVVNLPKKGAAKPDYERRGALLSAAEKKLHQRLLEVTAEEYFVFLKVRIADVLQVPRGLSKSEWRTAFNKISAKHFDFVLCDQHTFEVLAVIELDDRSHEQKKTKIRDNFVDLACASAGLPMIRIKASASYNTAELYETIHAQMLRPQTL